MKNIVFILFALVALQFEVAAESVSSPDNSVRCEIKTGKNISFNISYKGKSVIADSPFGLQFLQSAPLGEDMEVVDL